MGSHDHLSESEICSLRPRWDKYVLRWSRSEPKCLANVHDCIMRTLTKGYSQTKLSDRLTQYLSSGRDADRLAEKVFSVVDNHLKEKTRKRHRKSGSRDHVPHNSYVAQDRASHSKPDKVDGEEWEEKRARMDDGTTSEDAAVNVMSQATKPEEPVNIQEMMMNAQRQILERQVALNIDMSELRAKKMLELQARISMQMGTLSDILNASDEHEKPVHVTIDKDGRTIDTHTGQIVRMESRLPTLKANIRAAQRNDSPRSGTVVAPDSRPASHSLPAASDGQPNLPATRPSKPEPKSDLSSHHLDTRISCKPAGRQQRRGFNFVSKGKYQGIGQRVRAKQRLDMLQKEIEENVKKTKIVAESKYVLIQQSRKTMQSDLVPDIEWWDTVIIHDRNCSFLRLSYDRLTGVEEQDMKRLFAISNLVEHPSQIKPQPKSNPIDQALPVYLTKKERKKLRRQNRAETLREQQEKVRLGLIQPPEPKVRISNLMKVLGSEAVQDPSKVETYVKNQMEKRFRAHQDANESRRLTAQQRRDKIRHKLIANGITYGLLACVYRVFDLSDPSTKFKVEANCKQLYMTGCVVLCKELNVVVVEGGPKQQKLYKKLMMRRIKWNDLVFFDKDGNEQRNKCSLVWEGVIKDHAFSDIQFKISPSETFAREFFKKHDVEHYWNIVLSDVILESSQC